jgi:hypothetical protein
MSEREMVLVDRQSEMQARGVASLNAGEKRERSRKKPENDLSLVFRFCRAVEGL